MNDTIRKVQKKYHIALIPPLVFTSTSCFQFDSSQGDHTFWEGSAMVDMICSSYVTYDGTYYYGACESYEETIVELPIQYRAGYIGLYKYTGFANYLLEISTNYVIFSYIYHYTYASLLYNENYEYTAGFSYMFPYTKDQNTYRIDIPYSNDAMTCQFNETLLNCSAITGISAHIAYKKSRRTDLQHYLKSL
jgi:hypothetical protein